jgi:hypothetical protein
MREPAAWCQCTGKCRRTLKFKAAVFLSATGAGPVLHLSANHIQVIATDAAERGPAAFPFEAGVVATVIIQPEAEEERGDEQAVNESGDLQAHEIGEWEKRGNSENKNAPKIALRRVAKR